MYPAVPEPNSMSFAFTALYRMESGNEEEEEEKKNKYKHINID